MPLTAQLSRPLFTLAAAGVGQHTLTISVTPDNLGPVTVLAHVSPEGFRVELFAPSDVGRDAIRAILPELRKDLSGAGLGSNLDLSAQNQPTTRGDRDQARQPAIDRVEPLRAVPVEAIPIHSAVHGYDTRTSIIDVMV